MDEFYSYLTEFIVVKKSFYLRNLKIQSPIKYFSFHRVGRSCTRENKLPNVASFHLNNLSFHSNPSHTTNTHTLARWKQKIQ